MTAGNSFSAHDGSHYRRHSPAAGEKQADRAGGSGALGRLLRITGHLLLIPFAALTMVLVLVMMPLLSRLHRLRHR